MTYACGRQFSKYMERFFPVLEMGLKQYQASSTWFRPMPAARLAAAPCPPTPLPAPTFPVLVAGLKQHQAGYCLRPGCLLPCTPPPSYLHPPPLDPGQAPAVSQLACLHPRFNGCDLTKPVGLAAHEGGVAKPPHWMPNPTG